MGYATLNSIRGQALIFVLKKIVCSVILLSLVGCAHFNANIEPSTGPLPGSIKPANWSATKKHRQSIKSWELRGRLGIQTADNGGSLDLNWHQDGDNYVIRLLAPLGQGSYLISGNLQSVMIRLPDGKTRILDNPDALFKSTLGFDLPVSALRDWVRGLPAASLPLDSIRWNRQGLLHVVDQAGWHVVMSNDLGGKIRLPYKIYLSRKDRPELDIRLVLRQWMVDN